MKTFINSELKIENQVEELVKHCIERTLQKVKIEVDFFNLNFDYQHVTSRSNIDEIEIIKSLSNINFIYASYYSISSKTAPNIIDKSSFNELKLKLNEKEIEFIENCYISYDDQFLLKNKIPELKFDIDQSIIDKLFNIIKNDGFETYIERNMENYFIVNKNLKSENYILRLLFVSKVIKMDNKIETSNFPQTSIEEFLDKFEIDLLEILNESDGIQKLSLNKKEKNIKIHHEKFCEDKLKIFVGRTEKICYIRERINDPSVSHIVIHGNESGSGKTTLLAYIKVNIIDKLNLNQKIKIVTRFIGISKDSYNIQSVLYSIIEELSIEYVMNIDKNQLLIDRLFDYFKSYILKIADLNKDTMFYFILDSLDQLEKENDARKLGWLPILIPSNIRFIVSTLSQDEYEAYPILFSIFASTPQRHNFILVSDLTNDDLDNLIDKRLDSIQNYSLKNKMKEFLNFNFKNIRKHSLHVKLILDESFKWTSFTDFDNIIVAKTADYAIEYLFEKIENSFQKDFIQTALRYLTLSRKGIYFDDWIKLLSQTFINPGFTLLQVISELKQYLFGPLYRWYHRKFIEIANRRYCFDINNKCVKSHKMVVDTFVKDNYGINDRFWINELPYHSIYSKDIEMVKEKFLLNIKFMKTKIDIVGIDELINDYLIALKIFNDSSFKIIHSCLTASSNLRHSSKNLTTQLLGRIPRNFIELAPFIENCVLFPERVVIPNKKYLSLEINQTSTVNVILHNKQIVYLALTNNKNHLIINTIDKIIKIFSINDLGTERSKFERAFLNTEQLLVSNDDNIVYALGTEKLKHKELSEGIIEAFDIVDKKRGFSIKRLDNEFVEHHGFALGDTFLLILTNRLCYKINCKDGVILEIFELPHKWPDSVDIQVSFQNGLIVGEYFRSSNILFGTKNEFSYYDFTDYHVRGNIIFLPNSNILLPMRKDFKTEFNNEKIWKLLEFNVEKMEVIKQIRLNKALNIFGVSLDGNYVYGFCYSYIYCLDISNEILVYALQHYASINSAFVILDDKRIISSSKGNYICIYDTEKSSKNKDIDPFSGFNSREVKFMMDNFSSRCPLVLVYNIFEKNEREIYLLYDLKKEKIIKKFELFKFFESCESYDFNPLSLISTKAMFVESFLHQTYFLISIKDFKMAKTIKSSTKRIFERINYTKFLISHNEFNEERLSIFEIQDIDDNINCVLEHTVLCNLEAMEWFLINQINFIYKLKDFEVINVYNLIKKQNDEIFILDYFSNIQSNNIFSSLNGKYFVFYDSSKVNIFNLQTKNLKHEISIISKKIEKAFFTDCLLVLFFASEDDENEMFCFVDPDQDRIILEECTCYVNKKSKTNYPNNEYKVIKHRDSNYIWIQSLLYSGGNILQSELVVYDMNDLSESVFTVDTEFKLRINEIQLIGDYLIAKEFEKINFVVFCIKKKKICCSDFDKDLFDEASV